MQPDRLSGKDVELLVVGLVCLGLAGSSLFAPGPNLVAFAIFAFLGLVSFGLAWWDVRRRDDVTAPWE